MEDVTIFRLKTGEAVESIKDLKENIKQLKKELEGYTETAEENGVKVTKTYDALKIGTKEYADTLSRLKANQSALKDAMNATTASLDQVKTAATGAGESYNALVHRMSALKEEWRTIDTSTEAGNKRFLELSEQIELVNRKLKNMDAGIGNHQRNVGNYVSALDGLSAGFKATAGSASSMIAPIAGATTGLKAMSATPAVAVMGLLANILVKVIDSLKSSETNANAAAKAMTFFAGAGDVVKGVMQVLGKAVGKVADVLGNLAYKIFPKLREAADLRNEITQKEIDLSLKQRKATEDNADAELEIARLRQEAADKVNLSAEERIALLEKANAIELQISQRNVEIAKAEYEIQKLRSKTSENSKEENDALAQSYANMRKAETDYFSKSRELVAQISRARKEAQSEADKQMKDEQSAREKSLKEESKAKQRMISINKSMWEQRLVTAKKGSEDEYTTRQAILEDEYILEKEKAHQDIADADELVKTLEVLEMKYYDKRMKLADDFAQAQEDAEAQRRRNEVDAMRDGTMEKLNAEIALKKWELDTMHQLEEESDEAFYARKIAKEKEYIEATRNRFEQLTAIAQGFASATASILGSIGDLYEQNGENDVRSARKAKAVRIASATIDTISGAIGAYMQSVKSLPAPMNVAVGAAQAAAVTASGIAQIAKIRATKIDGSENGTADVSAPMAASVSAPVISEGVRQTSLITTARDEQRLNAIAAPQRVYILQSDIEAAGRTSRVRVAEASF